MPTIVQRVSNAGAQGTRWRATPNAHRRKDQTVKISAKREETTSPGWLIFTPVNWLSFIALQTPVAVRCRRGRSWQIHTISTWQVPITLRLGPSFLSGRGESESKQT
jgi:hypothetical protein